MSLPRNNDPWCISVPSSPSVTPHPVGGWCSLFPFRNSFLSSFMLRRRLPCYFPGQISFYSLQRGHTQCFSKVCMCTHIYKDCSPKKSVFHTLQQCSEMSSASCTGKCLFSSALHKCTPSSSHMECQGHEQGGDFSGRIYPSSVLGIHSKKKLMLLKSTVCIIFWLLSGTFCELFSIWKVKAGQSCRRQLLDCKSLWVHMKWILFSQMLPSSCLFPSFCMPKNI
jgi:hypothetical protein